LRIHEVHKAIKRIVARKDYTQKVLKRKGKDMGQAGNQENAVNMIGIT